MGLMLSGMADPAKVLAFLHMPGTPKGAEQWDPSLFMVMLFGVLPNALFYWRYKKGTTRLRWAKWNIPTRSDVDAKLIAGAVIFGAGWGLAGVCPGPAIVGLASAVSHSITSGIVEESLKATGTFVLTMLLGMASSRII